MRRGATRGPRGCLVFSLRNGPGRVDQSDVAEGLRKVPERLTAGRVDLLREQAHVVGVGAGSLEGRSGPLELARDRLRLGQPEGADQEGSFLALQTVVGAVA